MADGLNTAVQWQEVKCDRCGREYQCTPWDDYYETPAGDHCCEPCLLKGKTLIATIVETDDGDIIVPNLENPRG
jgi:hypothetical protein